ncbi:MAG TPA: hypothetical protein VGJ82_10680 [Thermoanaerobaculia bacterium]
MRSFRNGLAVVSLCAAMLIGGGKSVSIRHHSRATFDDDVITTIVNALVDLESRISLPPG